ncbi:MAG TPA: BTAD domain-containing putative transcriptional regulator [Jatrophihabitantaceae bacterium]|nr:BTAD domain-containing putative transcriptional regulator [Jatrophihabitantaceae bacterium]
MIRIRILGPVELEVDGRPIALGPRKQRFVLAVLALEANRAVPVARLITLTWPHHPPRTAEHAIRVAVSQLRTILERAGVDPDDLRVVTSGDGYLLHANNVFLDVDEFRRLTADARTSADHPTRVRLLDEALALWRGPALAGAAPDGHQLTHSLDDARLAAIEDRFNGRLQLGEHRAVLSELPELIDAHPADEGLIATYMLALYRSGRASDALAAYQQARTRLVEDLGIDPGPALQSLHTAILRNDAGLDLAERSRPAQLPRAVAGFSGRQQDLKEVDRLATDGAVVVVVGAPGVGKTALSIQWAHRTRGRFLDGQLYLRLRGNTAPVRPIDALASLLRALDIAPERIPTDLDDAAAMYRTAVAERHMLIMFDDAASAAQVRPLLPGGPGNVVVVTSRDRLSGLVATDGASPLPLDVLSTDEATTLVSHIIGASRVALEPAATADLTRRCGYLPLALRIAAANLVDRPDGSIADQVATLDSVGRLAELQARGDEQAGVRAAFDSSYQVLSPPAQRLFRMLGVAPGPDFTDTSAAALAELSIEEAGTVLETLRTAHLIEDRSAGRFALHDLLRVYAGDRAEQHDGRGEIADATARLAWFYLRTTDSAARLAYPHMQRVALPGLTTDQQTSAFTDDSSAVVWLDSERPNLVAVAQHAADHGPHDVAWLLADHLRGYFWLHRHTVDWLAVADAGLAAATADHDAQGVAAAHINLGQASRWLARFDDAVEHYAAARSAAQQAGWTQGEATALGSLANTYRDVGELHSAAEYHGTAGTLFRRLGNQAGEAVSLSNLGNVYCELGRLTDAADALEAAVAAYRAVGSRAGEATALTGLGPVYLALGRYTDASDRLRRALAIREDLSNSEGAADCLADLANVQREAGQYIEAVALATKAIDMTRELVDHRVESNALNALGFTHACLLDFAAAQRDHAGALARAEENDYRYGSAIARVGLAEAGLGLGDNASAKRQGAEALTITRRYGFAVVESDALIALANVELADGDVTAARTHADAALASRQRTGCRSGEARVNALVDQIARITALG